MEKHFYLTDDELEEQFENCKLNPLIFSHEAHLRLAWVHIIKYGIEKVILNVPLQLKYFTEYVGEKEKYNETLTIAAIQAVYHFTLRSKSDNFTDFITEFPRLKNNFRKLMDFHYGFDIFNSDKAKREYFEPDLLPFD